MPKKKNIFYYTKENHVILHFMMLKKCDFLVIHTQNSVYLGRVLRFQKGTVHACFLSFVFNQIKFASPLNNGANAWIGFC